MKTSLSKTEFVLSKTIFVTLLISLCFTFILSVILANNINHNKRLIDKLQYQIQELKVQDESLIKYLNADKVKFVLEQYDSIDTQLSNHLDMILENQNDIVRLRK